MQTTNQEKRQSMNKTWKPTERTLKALWAKMRMTYPSSWSQMNGADCTVNGQITPEAANWLQEISVLTAEQMRDGMKKLSRLKTNGFAPNVIEFVQHCKNITRDETIDEIWDFINRSDNSDFWWQTDLAYTVFKNLRYNKALNERPADIQKRIERIFDTLDQSEIEPAPPKPQALEHKSQSKAEFLHQAFQGSIYHCLRVEAPEMLMQPLDPDGRLVDPKMKVPDEIKNSWGRQNREAVNLFKPTKTRQLMQSWAEKIGDIADVESFKPNMLEFLRGEGFAI